MTQILKRHFKFYICHVEMSCFAYALVESSCGWILRPRNLSQRNFCSASKKNFISLINKLLCYTVSLEWNIFLQNHCRKGLLSLVFKKEIYLPIFLNKFSRCDVSSFGKRRCPYRMLLLRLLHLASGMPTA